MKVVIAGAGVAGAIIARGLADLPGIEVHCLERVTAEDHGEAGTGLNVGPNAIKALSLHLPELAGTVTEASIPWQRWTIDLTDGTRLFDLDLADVADNPGIRIRWAELYRILRDGAPIRYGEQVTGVSRQEDGRVSVAVDTPAGPDEIADVDLLIAADGRYSRIRSQLVGPPDPRHLRVSMYRVLMPRTADCPIDDYAQWFCGPNRLLAFAVPGDLVYCAGTFPITSPDGSVSDDMKRPETLRALYTPPGAAPSREAAFLIEGIVARTDQIHWARVQEDEIAYAVPDWPVLLVGDASHPMIPTLGQGATQAVEDACAVVAAMRGVVGGGATLASLPAGIDEARRERVRFVMDFSREASDTMLDGADPVAGTVAKLAPAFQDRLKRLYRDVA